MKHIRRLLPLVCLSAALVLLAACGGIPHKGDTERVTAGVTLPSGSPAETGTVPPDLFD